MADAPPRPLPQPTPLTQPYWDAARQHRLVMPRRNDGTFFWYPRALAPGTLEDDFEWVEVSGRGRLYSFTVDRRGTAPAFAPLAPYVIGIVELEEGPHVTANIVDCPIEEVRCDMPLEVVFEDLDGATLVNFRPRRE